MFFGINKLPKFVLDSVLDKRPTEKGKCRGWTVVRSLHMRPFVTLTDGTWLLLAIDFG